MRLDAAQHALRARSVIGTCLRAGAALCRLRVRAAIDPCLRVGAALCRLRVRAAIDPCLRGRAALWRLRALCVTGTCVLAACAFGQAVSAEPRRPLRPAALASTAGALSTSFEYSLAFTHNQRGAPERGCTHPICRQLLTAIDAASSSIEFAVYGVRGQPALIDALARAQRRGVRVHGVVDSENADCTQFGYPDTPQLRAALAPGSVVCDTGAGYSYIMHDKFFVFDAARVWTGSTNLSDTETGGEYNSDVAVLIDLPELAATYDAEFAQMWSGKFHHRKTAHTRHVLSLRDGTRIESYFSPVDRALEHAVLPLIDGATRTLDIAMFYFTAGSVAGALLSAQARGVRVRMVLDAEGARSRYSQHRRLCAAGIAVKIENWGGKSHSKWAVADAAVPGAARVVFGSMNWTSAGDTNNDENTLLVQNAALARAFAAEFERQWADLQRVPVCTELAPESAQSSVCAPAGDCSASCTSGACCDGIDNDYDGKLDLQEEACACHDGVDNDGNGLIDAADSACQPPRDDP